jgi:hypothetical protein
MKDWTLFRKEGPLVWPVIRDMIFDCQGGNPVAVQTILVFSNQDSAEYLQGLCEKF